MWALFDFPNIIVILTALLFMGTALAFYGTPLVLRKRSLTALVLPQCAVLGYVIGRFLGIFLQDNLSVYLTFDDEDHNYFVQIIEFSLSLIITIIIFAYLEKTHPKKTSADSLLALGYLFFLSLTVIFISIFPSGEMEMMSALFGNILAIELREVQIILLVSLISLVYFFIKK